jgi:hypothetical protein
VDKEEEEEEEQVTTPTISISHLTNCLAKLMHLDQVETGEEEDGEVLLGVWDLRAHLEIPAFLEFLGIQDLLDPNLTCSRFLIKFKHPKGVKKGPLLTHFRTCRLKLGLWGREVLREWGAHLGLRVLWVCRGRLEIRGLVVHQVHQDQEAYLDFPAKMVKVVWMGNPGQVGQQVLQVKEGCRACQVYQALKDIEAFLASMGLKEM